MLNLPWSAEGSSHPQLPPFFLSSLSWRIGPERSHFPFHSTQKRPPLLLFKGSKTTQGQSPYNWKKFKKRKELKKEEQRTQKENQNQNQKKKKDVRKQGAFVLNLPWSAEGSSHPRMSSLFLSSLSWRIGFERSHSPFLSPFSFTFLIFYALVPFLCGFGSFINLKVNLQ